jgi:hypothetical protein
MQQRRPVMYHGDGPKERDGRNGRGENRHREQNVSFAGLAFLGAEPSTVLIRWKPKA